MCNLNEFAIATRFDFLAGLAGRSTIENLSPIFLFQIQLFYGKIMVTCDQQEKVGYSPKVLLGNFLQITNLF